ncbi:MAG: efflux RND transporter periplasmic adaptor subunit [Spirochaetia bacterium]|jgi:RND family efflux transporter MFP subunit|nr:efflux RND transporter periplasmic adaptor subunit [Spirochaetia bacterium]
MLIKKIITAGAVILIAFTLTGCAAKKTEESLETRSIAQIHEEEGVPVSVVSAKTQPFSVSLQFTAAVTGITESSASASIDDNVDKILYKVGDYVEKDTVIVKFPYDNPAANYYQSKAAYENSFDSFKRIEQLYNSKGVSRQDYDNAKTAYDVAKANWDSVNNMVNVKAPISGYITRLDVRESENVESGKVLFTIGNNDRLKARLWISEKDISKVKSGMNASAYWEGYEIKGKVVQTDLSLNPEKQAFGAIVEFDNSLRQFKSGITAKISIFVYENSAAFTVNNKYLIESGGEKYLYTASGDTAVRRTVKTGERSGQIVEIRGGLNTGDLIITEGSRLLTESGKIRIVAGE